MNSKECLKHICNECQKYAGKIQVACPFRSISNEYCDEYETIKQDLEMLEIIKKHLIISGLSITCFIGGNPSCKEVYEKRFEEIKRWLKSE